MDAEVRHPGGRVPKVGAFRRCRSNCREQAFDFIVALVGEAYRLTNMEITQKAATADTQNKQLTGFFETTFFL